MIVSGAGTAAPPWRIAFATPKVSTAGMRAKSTCYAKLSTGLAQRLSGYEPADAPVEYRDRYCAETIHSGVLACPACS
jgi:hypothetical protein